MRFCAVWLVAHRGGGLFNPSRYAFGEALAIFAMIASRLSTRSAAPRPILARSTQSSIRPHLSAWQGISSPVASTSYGVISPNRTWTAASTAEAATATSPLGDDVQVSKAASAIIQYSINFARTAETYEVHSWMLLLGLLKQENCRAALILKDLGLNDLYGAWNEVRNLLHGAWRMPTWDDCR